MSQHVEVTRRSLGRRSKDSFGGALFGLVLVVASTLFLFLNEGRAVKRYKDLKEGAGAVVSLPSDAVDPARDRKLVHLTGETRTSGPVSDADFGLSADAVKLIRRVEMYQWVEAERSETRNKLGGGSETVTTYTYEKQWRDKPVDSTRFKVPTGHENPRELPYPSATVTADTVTLGAYTLPTFLIDRMSWEQALAVESLDQASQEIRSRAKLTAEAIFLGADPASPQVGDVRVRFSLVPNGPISVVAQQEGASLVPYRTKRGGTVSLLEPGLVEAADMFQLAQDRNKALTWVIRIGGGLLLALGFSLILGPIVVLAQILPFLGRLVGGGTRIVAFLLAGVVWSVTVSVAWIFYRPLLGGAILVLAVVFLVLIVKRLRRPASSPDLAEMASPPPLS